MNTMEMHGQVIRGAIDHETRCKHYHSRLDRVAIKFYCCKSYFPCYKCHEEYGCGSKKVWPKEYFNHKAIMCGHCGNEMKIYTYLQSDNTCPFCHSLFNPGCSLHAHLYFDG